MLRFLGLIPPLFPIFFLVIFPCNKHIPQHKLEKLEGGGANKGSHSASKYGTVKPLYTLRTDIVKDMNNKDKLLSQSCERACYLARDMVKMVVLEVNKIYCLTYFDIKEFYWLQILWHLFIIKICRCFLMFNHF